MKDLKAELVAFSVNEDGKESAFYDIYACIKKADISKVKKYVEKFQEK